MMTATTELIAEARKSAPGDDATDLAVTVHRLADALEAATAAPSDTDEVLAMLDDLNASGGIAYDDYSRLHDAVARLAPAADEVEPAYELLPGTRDALDALTIRPDGFWTDSREGHFRATGCDGTVCSVMHPDSAAWVEVTP